MIEDCLQTSLSCHQDESGLPPIETHSIFIHLHSFLFVSFVTLPSYLRFQVLYKKDKDDDEEDDDDEHRDDDADDELT